MRRSPRPKFFFTSWLAMALVLWSACAFSLPHAHRLSSAMGQTPTGEICSALRDQQMPSDDSSNPNGGTSDSDSCGNCLVCSPSCLPTTEFTTAICRVAAVYSPTPTDTSFALTRLRWASPFTRAPPG